MNALKHGGYAKLACVLRSENGNTFHAILQSLVDRSKLPQLLAACEDHLTLQRQAVLNQVRRASRGRSLDSLAPQAIEYESVYPHISAAKEPKRNPQPVDSMEPPPPGKPGESPDLAEAA